MFYGNIDVDYDHIDKDISNIDVSHGGHPDFATYLQTRRHIHTRGVHQYLMVSMSMFVFFFQSILHIIVSLNYIDK